MTRKADASAPSPLLPNRNELARIQKLDLQGWCDELSRIWAASARHNLGLHKPDPNIIFTANGHLGIIAKPTVQLIGFSEAGHQIPAHRLPALLINIDAPDQVIRDELSAYLKIIRKYYGPSKSRRGPTALNSKFGRDEFAKWTATKIVPLANLLIWRAQQKEDVRKSYPNRKLGELLGLGGDKETSETKALLKKALADLPALFSQLQHEDIVAQLQPSSGIHGCSHIETFVKKILKP